MNKTKLKSMANEAHRIWEALEQGNGIQKARIRPHILDNGESIPTFSGKYLNTGHTFTVISSDAFDDFEFNTVAIICGQTHIVHSIDLEFINGGLN